MRSWSPTGTASAAVSFLTLLTVTALPLAAASPLWAGNDSSILVRRQNFDTDEHFLRIMPLGASITEGWPAFPGEQNPNGYRKFLRDRLVAGHGFKVNMVGSRASGTLMDSDHEGKAGDRISQVHGRASSSLNLYKPNVILINAGTNDATNNDNVASAHVRMGDLIDRIFETVPDAVVLLSTLIPNTIPGAQSRVDDVNNQYRWVAANHKYRFDGTRQRLFLADMVPFVSTADLAENDTTHPNHEGYRKMAAVWEHWILHALNQNSIKPAPPMLDGGGDDGYNWNSGFTCQKKYASGNANDRKGWQVLAAANPLISDDGPYVHNTNPKGTIYQTTGNNWEKDNTRYLFAQLTKMNPAADRAAAMDEMVRTYDLGNRNFKVQFANNNGGGSFGSFTNIDVKFSCHPNNVAFGDIDNDGLDDFICIGDNAELYVSRNMGGNPPVFEHRGMARGRTAGRTKDHVRLGDIDGDGRIDFCLIRDTGHIDCWRNGGNGQNVAFWQPLGTVFQPQGLGDIRGVRFVDINGDFRADWIWLTTTGRAYSPANVPTLRMNQRNDGNGLVPHWLPASNAHQGGFTLTDGGTRDQIQFGRVYGSGRSDYMVIERSSCGAGECKFKVTAFENTGSGGRFQKGDGIRWGDMRNRGVDDYLWISPNGVVNIFPNQNTKEDTTKDVTRGIWGGAYTNVLVTNRDRRSLHVADWDGDGYDDIISVDKNTGHLHIWFANFQNGAFDFSRQTDVTGNLCTQGWGVGYNDNGVHFARLTSRKARVDYLCMEPNGRITGWVNNSPSDLKSVGQIKFSEGLDRPNFQLADVNGDKKADLIWTDKFGGDARVWEMVEEMPDGERVSGSAFRWAHKGPKYLLAQRGSNQMFPNLGGQGRADMVVINPKTAHAWCWYNMCPTGSANDDVMSGSPLPSYSPPSSGPGQTPSQPGDVDFCEGDKLDDWNIDLWNRMEMESWLNNMANFYSEGPNWPETSGQGAANGIPEIISQYAGYTKDNRWFWDRGCTTLLASDDCDAPDGLDTAAKCVGHAQRAFALWASSNYIFYLKSLYLKFDATALLGTFDLDSLANKFIHVDTSSTIGNGPAAWLTILNGIFSTLAAVAGAINPVAGGVLGGIAGVLGMGGGIASRISDPSFDPRLSDWADINEEFGTLLVNAKSAFESYFEDMAASRPPAHDRSRAEMLIRAIGSGRFAPHHANTINFDTAMQSKMVKAAIISGMWNEQRVFFVRWTGRIAHDGKSKAINYCGGEVGDNGLEDKGFCFNNVNYLAIRWSYLSESTSFRKLEGLDELAGQGLSIETMFKNAWTSQQRLQSFTPGRSDVFTQILDERVASEGSYTKEDMLQWSIPVCDWNNLPSHSGDSVCGTLNEWSCIHRKIHLDCERMFYSGQDFWPYRLDV